MMSHRRVVALLDPPASMRFRSVPYLVESEARFLVCGWPDIQRVERLASGVDEIYQAGYAMKLDEPFELRDGFGGRLGWIGTEFLTRARELECAPLEGDEAELKKVGDHGMVWVPVTDDGAHDGIERWLREMAVRVFSSSVEDRLGMATLMKRCNPHHELTRAAVWWAFEGDAEEQERHLKWIERLARDRGEAFEFTPERQRACYEAMRQRLSPSQEPPSPLRRWKPVRQSHMGVSHPTERAAA